ncbi:MAG: hypothetical protein J0I20_16720 [Chloroflexi bacterium]|nr:hypothetical protein [Chloroflexota bacterium]
MASSLTQSGSDKITSGRNLNWATLKKPVVEILAVFFIYLALAIALSWPLALHFTDKIPGSPYSFFQDSLGFMWDFWWLKFSLFNLHTNPFHSDYLLYPYGADLYLHTLDPVNGLLSIPFRVFGLIGAFNSVIILSNTLTALATYIFAKELGLSRVGAVIAGFLITFSPLHWHFISGEIEFINFAWFILYLWLLLKMVKNPRRLNWGYILGGGVLIATTGYASAYALVWLAGVNLLWFGKELWLRRANLKDWLANWLLSWVVGVILLSPYLAGSLIELTSGNVRTSESLDSLSKSGVSLAEYIIPHYYNPLYNFLAGSNNPNGYPIADDYFFIGFVFLILAGLGTFWYFRQRELKLGFWLLVALVFGVLSLGPELLLAPGNGTGLPLPYRLLVELPFASIVRTSARFSEVSLFGLALAGGYAFQKISSRKYSFKFKYTNTVLAGLIVVALLFEFWKLPYPTNQFDIPEAYNNIQGNGAVLELPLNRRDTADAFAMYYQTVHGRPILPAYLSRRINTPYELPNSPLSLVVYRANQPDIFTVPPAQNALNMLRQQGVETIAFHPAQESEKDKAIAFLNQIAGQPYFKDTTTWLYRVTPGQAQPFFVLGSGWYDAETGPNGQTARWSKQTADFDIYMPQSGPATLSFQAVAFAKNHNLKIIVNGQEATALTVSPGLQPYQLKLNLVKGRNNIVLSGQEPAVSPSQTGQGGDTRELFIQVRQLSVS